MISFLINSPAAVLVGGAAVAVVVVAILSWVAIHVVIMRAAKGGPFSIGSF